MSDFLGCSRVLLVLFLTTFTFATAARTLSSASLASSSALRDTEPPSKLPREKRLTLYAAGFFPVSTKIQEGAIGRGVIPAVELALQHINDSPKILRGIHLDLVWNDTECNAALGMKTLFDMLYAPPPKVMLFGDACNSVTDPIAKASRFFHLIQLSYADTHPMYTSESYPNFFRVVPSESAFNPARLALIKNFNWTRVGTIYQNSPRYSLPHSKLLTDLDKAGIEIAFTQSIADETDPELQKLKEKDVRIIVGSFDGQWAGRIFCQAYKLGIFGRKYQWILGSFDDQWWEQETFSSDARANCSKAQILEVIDGLISIDVLPLSSSREITVSGMTSYEYEAAYNRLRKKEYSKYHGYAYDGVWTIAYAIHLVHTKLRAQNSDLTFKDFKYKDPFWAQFFRQALNETSFTGVTGNVSFEGNERKGSILFKQFQGEKEVPIGEYHSTTDTLDFGVGHEIYWRGGNSPPVDRTFRRILPSRVSLTLFVVISIFAVCGIILACVFLTMNIKYRNQKYIKMSSPYLNNMIIIGCILTYTSVVLLGLDSSLTSEANFPYICAARAWVLMSGFTLAFGSMFSKTWRVHAIFTNIKLNKKIIKDYKLFMVVGVLVFIDVVTLTTWQIVDPFYRETSLGVPVPSPQNEDILVVPEMEFCQSKRMTIFLGSIYVYKGLLMAFGIFLAWETRHVSIPALNDSKYIGMSVYNVVIMCVIGAGLSFVLRDQQDAAFVIISIFIIFCSTATLCLVFVPKLIELNSNPNAGEKRVRATLKPLKSRRDSDEMEVQQRIKVLTDENCRSRQRLKERTYELEALMFRLRGLTASTTEGSADSISVIGLSIESTLGKTGDARRGSDTEKGPHGSTVVGVVQNSDPSLKKQVYVIVAEKDTVSKSLNTTTSIVSSVSASPITAASLEQAEVREGLSSQQIIRRRSSEVTSKTTCPPGVESSSSMAGRLSVTSIPSSARMLAASKYPTSPPVEGSSGRMPISSSCFAVKLSEGQVINNNNLSSHDEDTSYSMAIKNTVLRIESDRFNNGFSSSCEEDVEGDDEEEEEEEETTTDREVEGPSSSALEEGDSSKFSTVIRRRARSEGTIMESGSEGKQEHPEQRSVFPVLSQLSGMSDRESSSFSQTFANIPSFSSYPSIKCDIVEYL